MVFHRFILSLAILACAACSPTLEIPSPAQTAAKQRPNIIVILTDDMRVGDTGFEGHPLIRTPNIDALAARSVYFPNAFATSPICTPSRTSLLTGQYERRHGVNFNSDTALSEDAWQKTYPMLLRSAGYFTGYIGKNHTPIGSNADGGIGYDSGVMESSFDYWYASHGHLTLYPKDLPRHAIFSGAASDTQVEIMAEGMDNFFTPDDAFQAGRDFLTSRPADGPFALLVNFNVPHSASTGSMQQRSSDDPLYRSAYRDQAKAISLPDTYVAKKDVIEPRIPRSVYNGEQIATYHFAETPEGVVEREIRTMQTITGVDRFVGDLMAHLEEQDLIDNTIIVFTSDHGLMFGEHGLGGKSLLYEESISVPLWIAAPGIAGPSKRDELVGLVDIAPTLLEFGEVQVPQVMQGQSLVPLMLGKTLEWRSALFLENLFNDQNYPRIEGVRTKEWKYIRYFDRAKDRTYAANLSASIDGEQPIFEELFHLSHDPQEVHNVIAEGSNAAVTQDLRKQLDELVKAHRGAGPPATIPMPGYEVF